MEKATPDPTLFFRDGERRIDMVLTYEDEPDDGRIINERRHEARETYQKNLIKAGLRLEIESKMVCNFDPLGRPIITVFNVFTLVVRQYVHPQFSKTFLKRKIVMATGRTVGLAEESLMTPVLLYIIF